MANSGKTLRLGYHKRLSASAIGVRHARDMSLARRSNLLESSVVLKRRCPPAAATPGRGPVAVTIVAASMIGGRQFAVINSRSKPLCEQEMTVTQQFRLWMLLP